MSFLDRLNLRPQEKRLVVGIGVVVFIVLNVWLVWPHFKDWSRVRFDKTKSENNLATFQKEIAEAPASEGKLKLLEGQGAEVLPEEMAIQLRRIIETKARESGVNQNGINPGPKSSGGKTNQYFEEQSINMNFANTGDKELLDFLYSLSAGNSTIRVRELSVYPDPSRTKLQGSVTLVASFQKKAAPKLSPAKPAAVPAKPAAVPAKSTPAPAKTTAPAPQKSIPPKTLPTAPQAPPRSKPNM